MYHHPPYTPPDWSTSVTVNRWRRSVATITATGLLALGIVLIAATVDHPGRDRAYQAGLVCVIVAAVTFSIAQNRDDQVRAAIRNECNAVQRAQLAARLEALGCRMDEVMTRMDEVMERVDVVAERVDLVLQSVDLVLQSEDIVIRHLGGSRGSLTPLRRHN